MIVMIFIVLLLHVQMPTLGIAWPVSSVIDNRWHCR